MAIIQGNIDFRLSGGAANSDPNASLGGAKSSEEITSDEIENLFDNVGGSESAAGDVEFRCIYFHNDSGTNDANNARAYLTSNTTSTGDELAIGAGSSAVNGTEQTITDEEDVPDDVVFTEPVDYENGIVLGNVPDGEHKAIWIRRTVEAAASAKDNNVATLEVGVDTSE